MAGARQVDIAGNCLQAGDRAMNLHTVRPDLVDAAAMENASQPFFRVKMGDGLDVLGRNAADDADMLWSIRLDLSAQLVETMAPALDEGLVITLIADQHMQKSQG